MLVPYEVMLFFPGGNPAVGASVVVAMDGSNQPPLIFTDSAGAFPAANPATADGSGTVAFYAAPGLYVAELAGSAFRVPVAPGFVPAVHADVFVHVQSVAAAVWAVDHFFGTPPGVSVVSAGAVIEAQVDHPSATQAVITFGAPVAGTAYLRR